MAADDIFWDAEFAPKVADLVLEELAERLDQASRPRHWQNFVQSEAI